jgi:hypothetical protein
MGTRAHLHVSLAAMAFLAHGCTDAVFVDLPDAGPDAGRDSAVSSNDAGADATDVGTDAGAGGAQPSAAGQLVITEIMFDSTAIPDDCGEWVEVHNPSTDTTYDLDGCVLRADLGETFLFTESIPIAPGAFVALANFDPNLEACADFQPAEVRLDLFTAFYRNIKFGNQVEDMEWVELLCGGTSIDEVRYQDFGDNDYLNALKGYALSLDPAQANAVDNDQASSWCPAVDVFRGAGGDADYGTPGAANPPCDS